MDKQKKYERLYLQIKDIVKKETDIIARMATINAILYHKIDYFFWCGFYLLKNEQLIVGPYQGPIACMKLEKNKGVCWATVNKQETIIVEDVHNFKDHIACDSRSLSEIVIPVISPSGYIEAVLDVDSKSLNSFDNDDAEGLHKIVSLLFI